VAPSVDVRNEDCSTVSDAIILTWHFVEINMNDPSHLAWSDHTHANYSRPPYAREQQREMTSIANQFLYVHGLRMSRCFHCVWKLVPQGMEAQQAVGDESIAGGGMAEAFRLGVGAPWCVFWQIECYVLGALFYGALAQCNRSAKMEGISLRAAYPSNVQFWGMGWVD